MELFGHDDALHGRQAPTTELLGPRGADPATFEQLAGPVRLELQFGVVVHGEPVIEPTLGQVGLKPGAHLGPERFSICGVVEIHGAMLPEPEGARRTGDSGHHDLGAPLKPRLSKQHERNPRSELGDHKRPRHERPTARYSDHGANCPNHDEPRPKGSERPPPPSAGQTVPHHLT